MAWETARVLFLSCTYRTITAVIIVGFIDQTTGDCVVHLLVIGLGGLERLGLAVQVEVCTSAGSNGQTDAPDTTR